MRTLAALSLTYAHVPRNGIQPRFPHPLRVAMTAACLWHARRCARPCGHITPTIGRRPGNAQTTRTRQPFAQPPCTTLDASPTSPHASTTPRDVSTRRDMSPEAGDTLPSGPRRPGAPPCAPGAKNTRGAPISCAPTWFGPPPTSPAYPCPSYAATTGPPMPHTCHTTSTHTSGVPQASHVTWPLTHAPIQPRGAIGPQAGVQGDDRITGAYRQAARQTIRGGQVILRNAR